MTAKEYLSQAKFLDQRINFKIEQVAALNDLATKVTSVWTGMPHSSGGNSSKQESVIAKIIDLQNEINCDIDHLMDLKREILTVIKEITCVEHRLLLEKRYIAFEKWEKIAIDMNMDIRNIYREHGKSLEEIEKIINHT